MHGAESRESLPPKWNPPQNPCAATYELWSRVKNLLAMVTSSPAPPFPCSQRSGGPRGAEWCRSSPAAPTGLSAHSLRAPPRGEQNSQKAWLCAFALEVVHLVLDLVLQSGKLPGFFWEAGGALMLGVGTPWGCTANRKATASCLRASCIC